MLATNMLKHGTHVGSVTITISKFHLLAVVLVSLVAAALAFGLHDFDVLYTAGTVARQGGNPYSVPMFVSPLSVLVYFIPISFLPEMLAFRLTIFISTMAYCLVLYRSSRGSLFTVLLALTTPLLLYNLFATNVDWMVVLASALNPLAGFWLAMLKPQIGGVLGVILLVAIFRRYGWRIAALFCAIQAAVYLASFALEQSASSLGNALSWTIYHGGNLSLFPWGPLLGLPFAFYAVRHSDRLAALASGPLVSPYVGPQSWVAILPWLAKHRWLLVLAWILSWLLILIVTRT